MGGILLKTHTSHSPRMRYKRSKFGPDRSLFKATLLWEHRAFSVYFWRDFRENTHLAFSMHVLKALQVVIRQ